ncbi:MAG: UDP-N-acetylenolpyruvoylglucosamine reductase [Sulfobacillus thermosulfidooxidans]|uniref:UDP-N-acetylenolpyruvoylglucosamine reductase n=1 Tax=Sulfobacillus thermosulfidooxidans TaxID=28034 RepID=A0A2T2X682_SULTH|nr:MAG: UDP-N-acetylenolpyruvoylglucosamine reductase [Sulfobacillus thermosulfidooxidans]
MNASEIATELRQWDIGPVLENEPLSRHTSFRIGGPASVYVQPNSQEDLIQILNWVDQHQIPFFVLGQGTNVLVSDLGLDAVVISTSRALRHILVDQERIVAGAGVLLTKLAHKAHQAALQGLEFAVSIPGTLGGALVMNAGAHGSEMRNIVEQIRVWEPGYGIKTLSATDAGFEYRRSQFMVRHWIALEASMTLKHGDMHAILDNMRHFMDYRKRTQPVGDANAGSVFKNPHPDYAGRLIESIGAKGWHVGDAVVSPVHANFIVNRGKAKARDVLTLMRRIRCHVFQRYHIVLRPEVRWIGPGEGGTEGTWENLWYGEGGGLQEPCE